MIEGWDPGGTKTCGSGTRIFLFGKPQEYAGNLFDYVKPTFYAISERCLDSKPESNRTN